MRQALLSIGGESVGGAGSRCICGGVGDGGCHGQDSDVEEDDVPDQPQKNDDEKNETTRPAVALLFV